MADGSNPQISQEKILELLEKLAAPEGDLPAGLLALDEATLKSIRQAVEAAKRLHEINTSLAEEINRLEQEAFDDFLEADARGRANGLLEAAQMIEDIEHFHSVDQRHLVRRLRTFSRRQYPNKMLKCEECGQSLDACCNHALGH